MATLIVAMAPVRLWPDNMSELTAWTNFYVIVGSAAGGLIGLQFVVMTLVANLPITRGNEQAGDAFSTPTVAHFAVVLLLSAAEAVPWGTITPIAVFWGLSGIGGVAYVVLVAHRMRSQTVYKAVFEDWFFHVLLPLLAYALLLVAAMSGSFEYRRTALFFVAAAVLLLLFTGIHNAWDIIRYHVFVKAPAQREAERKQ